MNPQLNPAYFCEWGEGFILPLCPVHHCYMEFEGVWAYCWNCPTPHGSWRLDAAPFVMEAE